MGELMRRYWVPILMSSELPEPDCAPLRVQILSENLLAFRDSTGRPGLVDEFCSHRGASLFFGRNEENGIRCSYHGLKFNVLGECVDVPSAPQACKQMGIKGYPCVERGGLIWAYMGPKELQPVPPALEWCELDPSHVFFSKRIQECNYLQAMEGGIDTAHVSYVHRYEIDEDPAYRGSKSNDYMKADGNVVFEIDDTEFGLSIYGRRNGEIDSYYWRVTQWLFPWFTLIPPSGDHPLTGHIWVPIDDCHCWTWSISFRPDKPLTEIERAEMRRGAGIHFDLIPGTFKTKTNRDNDYLIDRQSQKDLTTYSGIRGFAMQDASLQESMGPIQNRENEKLLPTDRAIAMVRRALLDAADAVQRGEPAPALSAECQRVRAAAVLLPRESKPQPWAEEHLVDAMDAPVYAL
ncbi:Rieske 2Fe-2S domain-containing protein [Methylovirgula ligni]|nr:Rieske 2Fe-2S domain-containing protein [Methylovirgula ligni]